MNKYFYAVIILLLCVANVAAARAHNWWYYYWPRTNMQVYIANDVAEAEAARGDWSTHTHLQLKRTPTHTDISVFAGNYGLTGWEGLTTIEQWGVDYPWRCGGAPWCRMIHVHSRFNSAYPASDGVGADSDVRGIFCMEIGHALGLAHDAPGLPQREQDCMGKNIAGDEINVTMQHSWADVDARY